MAKTVKTAGLQIAPGADREANIKRARELVGVAADKGAKIICLPQLFSLRWFAHSIDKANLKLAEPEDGPTISAMRECALNNKVVLIAPVFEVDGEDHFNTAFVIGPDGEIIGKYRKVHVPQIPLWEERSYFKPGDDFPVFDTPFGRIGVQLCWDTFFPEGFRLLALKGAEIVFVPTASAFFHSHEKWDRAIAAAAHSNGIFIWRVNRVGKEERQEFYGRSFCVLPDGEFVVNPSGNSEGVVLSDVNLSEVGFIRSDWLFMRDRRPELYKDIARDED